MKRVLLLTGIIALAGLAGWWFWPTSSEDPGTVLARIGDEVITVADFREEMRLRGGEIPGQYQTVEQRQALLDAMIQRRLMLAGARSAGYLEDEDVRRLIDKILVNKYFEEELRKRLDAVVITDEDVEAHYHENAERYTIPAQRRGAIIRVTLSDRVPEEQRETVLEELEAIREEAETGVASDLTHFGDLARQYSDDRASRYQGGVIGWLEQNPDRPYRWAPEVAEALFELDAPGAIAGPLVTAEAAYLVRLVDRKPAELRPLERVADGIRHALNNSRRDQVREAFLAEIRESVPVEIRSDRLEAVRPLSDAAVAEERRPPPMPAG